eukprot:246609_1
MTSVNATGIGTYVGLQMYGIVKCSYLTDRYHANYFAVASFIFSAIDLVYYYLKDHASDEAVEKSALFHLANPKARFESGDISWRRAVISSIFRLIPVVPLAMNTLLMCRSSLYTERKSFWYRIRSTYINYSSITLFAFLKIFTSFDEVKGNYNYLFLAGVEAFLMSLLDYNSLISKLFVYDGPKPGPKRKVFGSKIKTMYHITDEQGAKAIATESDHQMRRGKVGMFGGGIYFAESIKAAMHKTEHPGVLITARVFVGKEYHCKDARGGQFTFTKLQKMGYDSVYAPYGSGHGLSEQVVYNRDQVCVMDYEKDYDIYDEKRTVYDDFKYVLFGTLKKKE